MDNKITVQAENVAKMYTMYDKPKDRINELLLGKKCSHTFYAVRGISFNAYEGDSIGLVGLNGSGKSTLANMIGGISSPTEGIMSFDGIPSLISVNSGMSATLTGRQNIHYKGLLIGLDEKQINELSDRIIDFADIGAFIDQPLKTYSSGMKARLGFAISVNIDPDILVIDEALSVGDPSFTHKCLAKMKEFRTSNKTIFFVSHSLPQMHDFCSKIMWLEYGIMKAFGETDEVLPMYERFIAMFNNLTQEERKEYMRKKNENQTHLLIK